MLTGAREVGLCETFGNSSTFGAHLQTLMCHSHKKIVWKSNTKRKIESLILTLSLKCPLVLASMFVCQQAFCFPLGRFQYFQKKLSTLRIATGTQQQQEVGIQQRKPEGRQTDRRQGLSHSPPAHDVYWFIWFRENKFYTSPILIWQYAKHSKWQLHTYIIFKRCRLLHFSLRNELFFICISNFCVVAVWLTLLSSIILLRLLLLLLFS